MLDEIFNNYENNILKQQKLRIKNLSPIEFETMVSNLLVEMGFAVEQTPPTNDGGKDIIACKQGKRYYIECKHFSEGAVGREIVQKLVGAGTIDGNVDGFIVVTSSYFNNNAIECAEKYKNLLLWDLDDIVALFKMHLYNTTPFTRKEMIRSFKLDSKTTLTMDLLPFGSETDFFVNFRKLEYNTITESLLLPVDKVDDVIASLKTVPMLLSMLKVNEKAKLVAKENIPAANEAPSKYQPPKGMIGWRRR